MGFVYRFQAFLKHWLERRAVLGSRVVTFVLVAVLAPILLAAGRAWVQFDVMQAAAMVSAAGTTLSEPSLALASKGSK